MEFGCGYGTFTLAAAVIASGTVHALDIELEMVAVVRQKCVDAGITNVQAAVRDFVAEGTGLDNNSMDAALLFNILHHEEPLALMKEALRVQRYADRYSLELRPHDATRTGHGNPPPAGTVH